MTDISRKRCCEIAEDCDVLSANYDVLSHQRHLLQESRRTIYALRDALDKAEAEKRELALQVIASEGQAQDAYAAQQKAEEELAMLEKGLTAVYLKGHGDGKRQSTCPHPNKQASTCGFYSCPDCGARLEE